jgi:hypothetical protein
VDQLRRLQEWFRKSERHLFEEVVRSRIVSAQIAALDAAEASGRYPKFQEQTEAKLAEAAFWREFLTQFHKLSELEGITLSQPTLKPITPHV